MKDCEYGQAEGGIVRDNIVFGTKSAKVHEKPIDIVRVARVDEVSVQQLKKKKK